jgi:Family of unknown function (DUF6111)
VRLTELLLFLTPVALFVVWRLTASVGGPSRGLILAAAGALACLAVALAWFSQHNALPPRASYVPAQVQDGHIIPGHAAP